mgnify:CR=1 FL=1
MAQEKRSNSQCQAAIDAVAKHGTYVKAAEALGLSEMTVQRSAKMGAARGLKVSPGVLDPNNVRHLLAQVKELKADLAKAQVTEVNHEIILTKIIQLKTAVNQVEVPDWLVDPRAAISAPGVPTLECSDWHVGEVVKPSQIGDVNRYDMNIFRARARTLLSSTVKLCRIVSPKMDYPGIVLPLVGDMVSGNIHEELARTNELETMPVVVELYGVLSWMIDELLKEFPAIFLPCVTGNHGRDTKKIFAKDRHHTNFDWLLYSFLAKRYEGNKRVTFFIPDGSDAYYKVYNHRYLLSHGDQFRGGDGVIGPLGPIIRGDHRKRSRNAQVGMDYDTMVIGHFHQYMNLTRLIVNGSLKGYDEYAYANNFPFEKPQQALWLTHPKYGITYRMPVYVDAERLIGKPKSWVSVMG